MGGRTKAKTGDSNLHIELSIYNEFVRWEVFDFVPNQPWLIKNQQKKHGEKRIPNFTNKTHIKIPSRVGKTNPVTQASFLTSQSFPQQKQKPTAINDLQKNLGPAAVASLPKSILNQKL